jgi:hypothetical protein
MTTTTPRYTIEPGLAAGFWVLDSWLVAAAQANDRWRRWCPTRDEADKVAAVMNGPADDAGVTP